MASATHSSLDDATARYVISAQPPFDGMRAGATRLAGYLLQRTLDPKVAMGQAARLDALGDLIAEAEAQLLDITPRGIVAVHHYRHLTDAMHSLRAAHAAALGHLSAARLSMLTDACERRLNEAIRHLRHAANALPGFEIVDLADCCGAGRAP